MIKLLTFSTLYPSAVRPNNGIFVETRLRHLLMKGSMESRVVAPVPWFPIGHKCCGLYGKYARTPLQEKRFGIDVYHPRYLSIPKIGMNYAPRLLAKAAAPACARLRADGYDFDAIDAHYFYPDGVAAAMLSEKMDRPVVITARGSDINLIANFPAPLAMIRWAAARAATVITVSSALKDKLIHLGVDEAKVRVLRNGVDLNCFKPADRRAARSALQLGDTPVLASVGNLVPEKGHDLVIKALAGLPEVHLLVVGEGAQQESLLLLARRLKVANRVRFLGVLSQQELVQVYSAVDLLVLASSREGWANVLLEAMACGTPAVATDVGAASEVIRAPEAGTVVSSRTAEALTNAIHNLLSHYPERAATRRYAERFSWDETTQGQLKVFSAVARGEVPVAPTLAMAHHVNTANG